MSAAGGAPLQPAAARAVDREHAAIECETEMYWCPYRVVGEEPGVHILGPFGRIPLRINNRSQGEVTARELNRSWHGVRLFGWELGQPQPEDPAAAIERLSVDIAPEPFGDVLQRAVRILVACSMYRTRALGELARDADEAGSDLWRAMETLRRTNVGYFSSTPTDHAIEAVLAERQRQNAKWGEQNHQLPHWMLILGEEVGEAQKAVLELAVANRAAPGQIHIDRIGHVKDELVHVAAVAVAILECMERHEPTNEVQP